MAQPMCVIEHFVRLFLGQWQCGLQPNLSLNTESDGVISVTFDMSTSIHTPIIEEVNGCRSNRRRSGFGSRSLRRKRRSQTSNNSHQVAADQEEILSNGSSCSIVRYDSPTYTAPPLTFSLSPVAAITSDVMDFSSLSPTLNTENNVLITLVYIW